MSPWTPERRAEYRRTIAMIRRSADRQAEYWWSNVFRTWAERVDALDLAVVDAVSSGIVITVPREAVRRGDLIVRNPDGSFGSYVTGQIAQALNLQLKEAESQRAKRGLTKGVAEMRSGFGDLKATLIAGFRSLPTRPHLKLDDRRKRYESSCCQRVANSGLSMN